MTRDELLNQVAERGELASDEEAARAIDATLATLGERIVGGEARDLAAQLPEGISRALVEHAGGEADAERFDAEEFVHRVASRVNTDEDRARKLVQVVFDVLEDAVSEGELRQVSGQLTSDYAPLLMPS